METITEDKKQEFEVSDDAPKASPLPTPEEAAAQGLTAKEIESAEKRGMVAKPEEKKEEVKKEETDSTRTVEKAEAIPDQKNHVKHLEDVEYTPEQFDRLKEVFPFVNGKMNPAVAMYARARSEKVARQRVEQERDQERQKREALEAQIAALNATKATQEVDDDGNPIDPEDKPLTLKQLRQLQQKEAEEISRKQEENQKKVQIVTEAQKTQEEFARSIFKDFDDTVNKAKEVMQNLETLIPEKWQQAKVVNLIRNLQVAAANADKIDLDDYHAALIAYEIGKMHPNYGKKSDVSPNGDESELDGKPTNPKKANGGHTPEQMKRIEENTNRRASSASIQGGGGKRTVSVDDVDAATLDKMSYSDRQKFKQNHPDKYARLLRV